MGALFCLFAGGQDFLDLGVFLKGEKPITVIPLGATPQVNNFHPSGKGG
ncbi:hypothetical protein D082_04820 [Synechocystis sp. PCC 6714]|nr:hypothetical protein D082_04820 [Synechocystis sp. PCC 6714]